MKKEIVISEADNIAAVIEDGRVVEFFLRQGDQLVGDIVLGQVESIVQGIEAAFINIGHDRNGFIHMTDLPAAQTPRKRLKTVNIRAKEPILVQIAKAPTGSKGARLTGRISIPGRFVVFVSHDNRVNISRRITSPQERERLRDLAFRLKDPGHGLIIRTEAEGASEEELRSDIESLIATWADILHQSQIGKPARLLYRDQDLLTRVVRECLTHDTDRIILDSVGGAERAKALLKGWMPHLIRNVTIHRGPSSMIKQYRLDRELKSILQPKVHLPSGGSLVIEVTEAMTVVDVNSGKLTSSRNLAETVLRTNLEAASELARQLRLRDVGGVVVVDFISMDHPGDQQKVLDHLHEAMKQDKSRPQIGAMFSEHGLLEISRRRQGQSILEQLTRVCPHCNGLGRLRNEVLPGIEMPEVAVEVEEIAAVAEDIIEEPLVEEATAKPEGDAVEREKKHRRRRRRRGGRDRENKPIEAAEGVLDEAVEELVEEVLGEPEAVIEEALEPSSSEEEIPAVSIPAEAGEEALALEEPQPELVPVEAPRPRTRRRGRKPQPKAEVAPMAPEVPVVEEVQPEPEAVSLPVEMPEAPEVPVEEKTEKPRRRPRRRPARKVAEPTVVAEPEAPVAVVPEEAPEAPTEAEPAPKKRPVRRRAPRPRVPKEAKPAQDVEEPKVEQI